MPSDKKTAPTSRRMRIVAGGAFVPNKILFMTTSGILHQSHKPKVHVERLMAVKKRVPRIVRREVDFDNLIGVHDHRVLQNAGCDLAVYFRQFKAVPMQVQRVSVVAVVSKDHAISFSGLNHQWIRMRITPTVDRPTVEAAVTSRNFFEN